MKGKIHCGPSLLLAKQLLALCVFSASLGSSSVAEAAVAPLGSDAAAAATTPVGSYAASVLASHPIGYWPLDEPAGSGTAADAVAGHGGVLEGGVTPGVPGAVDNRSAMEFAGSWCNGVVLNQNAASLQPQQASVEAWFRLSDRTGRRDVWRSRWYGFQVSFLDGEPAVGGYSGDISSFGADLTGFKIADAGWHHIVGVKGNNEARLYLDGRKIAVQTTSPGIYYGGDQVAIGRGGDACGWSDFSGGLDEVALYDRPLDDAEVRSHYDSRLPSPQPYVRVKGFPWVGERLRAEYDAGWSGAWVSWLRCDAGLKSCSPIAGAVGSTFPLGRSDIGQRLKVEVSGYRGTTPTVVRSDASSVIGVQSQVLSAGYWRQVALERAGVQDWNPRAGLNANLATIQRVYDYYGKLYLEDGNLYWAGLAKLAGAVFLAGWEDLDALARLADRRDKAGVESAVKRMFRQIDLGCAGDGSAETLFFGFLKYVTGGVVGDVAGFASRVVGPLGASQLHEIVDVFLVMQKNIFDDLGWQHEAYRAGGTDLMRRLGAAHAFPYVPASGQAAYVKRTWTDLANHRMEPFRALVEREQITIIQGEPGDRSSLLGGYNELAAVGLEGSVGTPFLEFASVVGASVVPGGTPFRCYPTRPVSQLDHPAWGLYAEIWGNVGDLGARVPYMLLKLVPEGGVFLSRRIDAIPVLSQSTSNLVRKKRLL